MPQKADEQAVCVRFSPITEVRDARFRTANRAWRTGPFANVFERLPGDRWRSETAYPVVMLFPREKSASDYVWPYTILANRCVTHRKPGHVTR